MTTDSAPHLRRLGLADAAAVRSLAEQLGYPSTLDQIGDRLRVLLGSADDLLVGAVDEDGVVCGWIHVQAHHALVLDPSAEICALVVDERQRGAGLGRALVRAAEAWARERGYREVRVRSNVVRERAHRFYERLGYARAKTSHLFSKALG